MIKIENIQVYGMEPALRGMRNPMNSWDKSDTIFGYPFIVTGPKDTELALSLANGGSVHAKYRRMITVYMDITAPLYWWKEMDTYKIGTVANSCSTMHKIHAKEFTLDDFSHEHLIGRGVVPYRDCQNSYDILCSTIECLNYWRERYINALKGGEDKVPAKDIWWQMIQLLPSSYNQKRTWMANYEVLANIYQSRKNHKLNEWRKFCDMITTLPNSEFIIGGKVDE